MIRQTIGAVLVAVGVVLSVTLLTYGGPVLPHMVGPVSAVAVGAALLLVRRKRPTP